VNRPRVALSVAGVSLAGYVLLGVFGSGDAWWLGDLRVYHDGGAAVLSGDGDLYEAAPGRLPFTYTPWAGLLFTSFGWMSWDVVRVLGVAANLALLGAATWLAWGLAGVRERAARVPLAVITGAALLWTEPVQENLRFGQINLLLVVLVLADLARPRGSRVAGVGIGLAAGLKLTPAIFIPYLLLTGRVREGLTAIGVFAGTVAVAFVVLPRECVDYWGGLFLDDSRIGLAQFPGNQSLNGAVARWYGEQSPPGWVWPVLAVLFGAVGMLLAVLSARRGAAALGAGLCGLTGLLVSPISWTHHWVWALPLVVALAAWARRSATPGAVGSLIVVAALIAAFPMHRPRVSGLLPGGVVWMVPFGEGRESRLYGWQLVVGNAYVLAGVVVLGAVLVSAVRGWDRRMDRIHPFVRFGDADSARSVPLS